MTPTQADLDAARTWLDREGPMHDTLGRVVRVNLANAGLADSLAALLAQTREAAYAQGWTDGATAALKAVDEYTLPPGSDICNEHGIVPRTITGAWHCGLLSAADAIRPIVQRPEAEK